MSEGLGTPAPPKLNIYFLYPTEAPLCYRGATLLPEDIPYFKSLKIQRETMLRDSLEEFREYLDTAAAGGPERLIAVLKKNGFTCEGVAVPRCTSTTFHDVPSMSPFGSTVKGSGHCVRWEVFVDKTAKDDSFLDVRGEIFDCYGYTR
ncbi:MAG: hypothetical protein Kilf2KO_07980 [Rhodospirillales bacterium]